MTCTCTDMWGNTTVEEFFVTVEDADGVGGGDTTASENDKKANLGLALGLGIGIPVALAAAAGVVFLLIKRGVIKLKRKKSDGNKTDDNNSE